MGFPHPIKHVITRTRPAHCTAGPKICEDCEKILSGPLIFCLLELSEENIARFLPGISLKENGKNKWYLYQLIKTFKSKKEAEEYSKKNNVNFINQEK